MLDLDLLNANPSFLLLKKLIWSLQNQVRIINQLIVMKEFV